MMLNFLTYKICVAKQNTITIKLILMRIAVGFGSYKMIQMCYNLFLLQQKLTMIVAEHAEQKKYFPDYTENIKLPSRNYFSLFCFSIAQ